MGDLETKRLQFSSVETVSLRWNNLPSYLICKVRNFTLYCHEESFFFWVLVAAFTVAEPILCSRKPLGLIYLLQVVVLGVSTLLYFIQLTGEAVSQWNRILDIDSNSMFESFHLEEAKKNILNESILIKAMIFFSSEGVYLLELMLLTLGWSLIFIKPGIAALRCFRVFRLLWFYEVDIFKITVEANLEPLFGQAFVARLFKVLNFSTKALSAMGNEIFRLTDETRGGLLLILILFYAAFVVAAALWTETEGKGECSSIALCMFTLMRLTFYDDIGFDYAFSLTEKHKFLFTIVMLYLIMTSLGILNGLVGIFGTVFARSSHLAFDDDAEELEEEEQSLLGDEEDEFPMKHDDKNSSDNNKLSIGTDFANIVNADKKEQDEDGSSNDDDDESVGLYSPSKSERSLMTSNFNITPVKPVGLVPIRQKSTTMRTMPSRNSKQSFKNVVQQRLISQAFQSAIADTSKTVKGGAVVSAGDSISENTNDVENNKPITSFNVKAKPQIGLFTQSFAKLPKPAQPSGGPTVPIEVNAYIRELNSKVQVLQNKLDGEGEMLDSFVQKMRAYATKKGIDVDALIPNNN